VRFLDEIHDAHQIGAPAIDDDCIIVDT